MPWLFLLYTHRDQWSQEVAGHSGAEDPASTSTGVYYHGQSMRVYSIVDFLRTERGFPSYLH